MHPVLDTQVVIFLKLSNGRYFNSFNKVGAVRTSWHLAGAACFSAGGEGSDSFRKVLKRLDAKKKMYTCHTAFTAEYLACSAFGGA